MAEPLILSKLSVDTALFSISKHLVDTKHLASLTDLPHMTNYKNLSNGKIIIDFLDQIAISGNLISFRKNPNTVC